MAKIPDKIIQLPGSIRGWVTGVDEWHLVYNSGVMVITYDSGLDFTINVSGKIQIGPMGQPDP